MSKYSNGTKKRKRAARGTGRLFKKVGAKQVPADSTAKGNFYIAYTVNGKRVVASLRDEDGNPITDRKQAEQERKRVMAPFAAGEKVESLKAVKAALSNAETERQQAIEEAHPPLKITDAAQAYIDSERRPDSGEVTLSGYLSQWKRFSRWAEGQGLVFLKDAERDHVRAYIADLNKAGFSASTFNQHLKTLVRFWNILEEEARITSNPWEAARPKTVDKVDRRKRALTIEEAGLVIETAQPGDLRDMLVLVAATGQRWGDICCLRWSAVGKNIITLVPAKTKRRKGEPVYIPILPQARDVLENRKKGGRFVFPELQKVYKNDSSTISKRIQKTFKEAGLITQRESDTGRAIVEVGGHSLRHTFVTLSRWAGLPDALIQKIVGHGSIRMTEHYTQFDKAIVGRLAESFDALPVSNGKPLALPETIGKDREPLPDWARDLVGNLNTKNLKKIKAELLKG